MKRTTKSILAFMLVVAMCVSFCVPTFAELTHDHEVEAQEASAVACPGKDGQHTLAILGLTAETAEDYIVKVVPAKCEGIRGYTIYKCPECQKNFVDNWVDGDGAEHDFDYENPEIVEPDCENPGSKTYTCKKCGETEEVPLNALGHDWSDWVIYKDGVEVESFLCTDGGVTKVRACNNCNETEEVEVEAGEHEIVTTIEAPTCITTGTLTKACEVCDYVHEVVILEISKTDPKAHNNLVYDVDAEGYVAPKCNEFGIAVNALCVDCGETLPTVEIAKVDHKWNKQAANAATCLDAGNNEYYVCEYCEEEAVLVDDEYVAATEEDIVIEALGHNEVKDTELSVEPTCHPETGYGLYVWSCSRCDAEGEEELEPLEEHQGDVTNVHQDRTCEQWGFDAIACTECGWSGSINMVPPYSHVVTDINNVPANMIKQVGEGAGFSLEPTCAADGYYVYKCNQCNVATATVEVPSPGHVYVPVVVGPTCAERGYTYDACACGLVDTDKEGVDTLGRYDFVEIPDLDNLTVEELLLIHVTKTENVTAPTCSDDGWSRTWCTLCSWYDVRQNVPALNHTDAETGASTKVPNGDPTAATCTTNGVQNWTCSQCNVSGADVVANATGHTFIEYDENGAPKFDAEGNVIPVGTLVELKVPTCTEKGYTLVQCRDCAQTQKFSEKNALGHTYATITYNKENADRVIYPQCNDVDAHGKWVYECDRCDAEHVVTITDVNDEDYAWDFFNHNHHVNAVEQTEAFRPSTCKVVGIKKYYCDDCDKTFDEPLEEKACVDFKVNVQNYKAPTCTDNGRYATYECESCQTKYFINAEGVTAAYLNESQVVINKLNHSMSQATCTAPAACTREGCDYTEGTALGHKEVAHDAKVATCTESGWFAYVTCERCDYTTYAVDAQKAHNVVKLYNVKETCVDPGYDYFGCTTCDTQDYADNYKLATGHSYNDDPDVVVEATCTDDGSETYLCLDCGEAGKKVETIECEYDYQHKNADNVGFTVNCVAGVEDYFCVQCETKIVVEHAEYAVTYDTVDCTEYIYKLTICVVCGDHTMEEVEKNAEHVWGNYYTVTAPTLTEGGLDRRDCTYCQQTDDLETAAQDGVQFDFDITNLVGMTEADGYAGRIKLVIDLTAKNISASEVALNIGFNNAIVTFVKGELLSADFTQDNLTFTAAEVANEKGYVVVMAASQTGDVKLTNGEFAVLYFDINVNAIGETVEFAINETTADNSTASGVANVAKDEINTIYTEIPEVETTRFGKLTAGDKVNLDDAAAILKMITDELEYCSEADINKDGYITVADYAIIRQLLVGNIESL